VCGRNRNSQIIHEEPNEPFDDMLSRELLHSLANWQDPQEQQRAAELTDRITRRSEPACASQS